MRRDGVHHGETEACGGMGFTTEKRRRAEGWDSPRRNGGVRRDGVHHGETEACGGMGFTTEKRRRAEGWGSPRRNGGVRRDGIHHGETEARGGMGFTTEKRRRAEGWDSPRRNGGVRRDGIHHGETEACEGMGLHHGAENGRCERSSTAKISRTWTQMGRRGRRRIGWLNNLVAYTVTRRGHPAQAGGSGDSRVALSLAYRPAVLRVKPRLPVVTDPFKPPPLRGELPRGLLSPSPVNRQNPTVNVTRKSRPTSGTRSFR